MLTMERIARIVRKHVEHEILGEDQAQASERIRGNRPDDVCIAVTPSIDAFVAAIRTRLILFPLRRHTVGIAGGYVAIARAHHNAIRTRDSPGTLYVQRKLTHGSFGSLRLASPRHDDMLRAKVEPLEIGGATS
jgi:hypothetical protein